MANQPRVITPFWATHVDETQHTNDRIEWGVDIDTGVIESEWDQFWLEQASAESDLPQSTSDLTKDNAQSNSSSNYSGGFEDSGVYTANELEESPVPPWDILNESLNLPEWDNLDDMFPVLLCDSINSTVAHTLPSPGSSINPDLQTANLELTGIDTPWNPFQATFDHLTETQAYENFHFPLVPNTHSPLLENSDWEPMHPSLYTSPTTGSHLPSMSSAPQSSTTSTANSISPPMQSPATNITNSISQSQSQPQFPSASNSSTPLSNQSTSTTPPSIQNEYKCTICSKTFSKRFELNKHTPLHTLPHACPSPLCPHRTARKRDMTRHITAKHKDIDIRNINPNYSVPNPISKPICPVEGCKRSFARSDHLLRHLRRKH